jgi:hypothetical protein
MIDHNLSADPALDLYWCPLITPLSSPMFTIRPHRPTHCGQRGGVAISATWWASTVPWARWSQRRSGEGPCSSGRKRRRSRSSVGRVTGWMGCCLIGADPCWLTGTNSKECIAIFFGMWVLINSGVLIHIELKITENQRPFLFVLMPCSRASLKPWII